ncbi:TrkH family potassium uptake protein, partial [bacterium]|nr:TrkH family potassium uptake protein [bacterium]
LSVIDIAKAPYCILFWRSAMQFAGGAGLVIIMLSAVAGPTGPGLSIAEGRGDQLVPNIRRSANLVLKLYLTYAISGIIAYYLAGMSLFDAFNHCFAAISTGGFSTQPANNGYWDSPPIEIISCVLMILGNLNFVTAYLIYRRQFHCVLRNGELHVFWFALPLAFLILLFGVTIPTYSILSKSIRVALFEAVSALTTTGFSTVTYNSWSHLGFIVLTLLMLIGGGTFSTAGGIKQYRIHILFKSFQWNLKQAFLPRTAILDKSVWMGEMKKTVSDQHVAQVSTFIFLYLSTYFIGVGILASLGYSLHDSLFEFASALGTVGISTGITQASSPPILLWSESIAMFLGRLEFFVVIVSIIKLIQDFISFFRTR